MQLDRGRVLVLASLAAVPTRKGLPVITEFEPDLGRYVSRRFSTLADPMRLTRTVVVPVDEVLGS
jgi:hypothetical protein